MNYNVKYRKNEKFSRCYYRNKKHLPPILLDNPDMVDGMMAFFRETEGMTCEKMRDFIDRKLIPKIVTKKKFAHLNKTEGLLDDNDDPDYVAEDGDDEIDDDINDEGGKEDKDHDKGTEKQGDNNDDNDDEDIFMIEKKVILHHYGLSKICIATVYRWMAAIGIKYGTRKKNYYVDGHEREDVVKSRTTYIKKYFCDEQRMYRWVQIPMMEFSELVSYYTLTFSSTFHYR